MKIAVNSLPFDRQKTDLLVLLLDEKLKLANVEDARLRSLLGKLTRSYRDNRIKKEYFSSWSDGNIRHILVQHSCLVSAYDVPEKLKILAASAIDQAHDLNLSHLTFLLNGQDAPEYFEKVVEGISLGAYYFDKYRKEKDRFWDGMKVSISVQPSKLKTCKEDLACSIIINDCVNQCRQLVSEPGAAVYPEVIAALARQIGRKHRLKVSVLDEVSLRKSGHNGLVSVGKGSIHPPRLVSLEYRPSQSTKVRLALVGKGITFDTGGISLKPGNRMLEMKGDMAGGAAVLYTMKAIAQLRPPISVLGVIPTAENMPDANALRPGDIFVPKNGKSVQVDNTDAEGRLVLIDGFEKAAEWKATHVVDIATLTGAVIRALGPEYAGIMGNDPRLIRSVIESGKSQGELFWELPLPEEYKKFLKTPYADLNNIGGSYAGAITAGLFLQEFIPPGSAWAHLDIAGPFLFDKGWKYYKPGATGFGVKTFVELCTHFKKYFTRDDKLS